MSQDTSYRVTIGEYVFDVTLIPTEDGLAVQVGDARLPAAWHQRGPHAGTLRLGDRTREVLLTSTPDAAAIALDGYQAEAQIVEARALRLAASLPARAAQTERLEVRAPMPGRVVSVRVAPGEVVARNTLLAVLEAMKMENELRAPQPGRVADVRVAEGDTVEHGALLLRLDPPPAD